MKNDENFWYKTLVGKTIQSVIFSKDDITVAIELNDNSRIYFMSEPCGKAHGARVVLLSSEKNEELNFLSPNLK